MLQIRKFDVKIQAGRCDNMEIKDIIKKRRIELGLTMLDVAKAVGVSEATVSRWESGNIANMGRSKVAALAKALCLPAKTLMGWDNDTNNLTANAMPLVEIPKVPTVGRIAAGMPILAEENIIGYEYIPHLKNPQAYFCLLVDGDSMINAGIPNGSTVLVQKQNCAEDGEIVVCVINGEEATLKRFKRVSDTVVLLPENPKYQPIIVNCADFESGYARICGVARRVLITRDL